MTGRRNEHGLVTLDWLLILAAVIGAAAGTAVLLQNMFEESAYEGQHEEDVIVRVLEADIAAARIAAEAQRLFESDGYDLSTAGGFKTKCEDLDTDFVDVLDNAEWFDPTGSTDSGDHRPARCVLTPKANLLG